MRLSRGCIYIDRSFIMSIQLEFWDRTYINRSSSCQLEFASLGSYLYQSIIHLVSISLSFWDRTYIDQSFIKSIQLEFWDCTYISRSSSVSIWVFEAAPISIGYFPISLSSVRVLGPHLYRSIIFRVSLSFRGHTYIDRLSSYQFEFSRLHLYLLVIFMSVCVQFE